MKIYLSFSLIFVLCSISFSQETIRIPDVAFEETLIDLKIDTNGLNGTILVSDARYVVNLNIFDPINNKDLPNVHSKIKDLTGIEYFSNLKRLICYGNEITKIDVSKNTELTFLNCSQNKIDKLDVSDNSNLFFLSCDSNRITSLKLGVKTKLSELYCNVNQLTELDLKNCSALESIDVSGNNKLNEVLVNSSVINNIPEGWYKDEKTTYVTEINNKEKVNNNVQVISKNGIITKKDAKNNTFVKAEKVIPVIKGEKKPELKTYDEAFKQKIVSEFEKDMLEYAKIKKKELQLKYNLDSLKVSNWIQRYGKEN